MSYDLYDHAGVRHAEELLDEAREAVNSWQPADPVKYTDSFETDQPPEPIYSERDLAEYFRLREALQAATHRLGQRRMAYQWDQFRARAEATIATTERWVAEATASAVWHYEAPKYAELRKFDSDFVRQVRLEAQMMYAHQETPTGALQRMDRQNLEMVKGVITDSLHHTLTEYVYGYPHKPIETRATHRFETSRPKSWWQMFKRDVLHRPYEEAVDVHEFEMEVSAKPFSAFPELPFKPDPKWGPRIDLMLPMNTSIHRVNREVTGG